MIIMVVTVSDVLSSDCVWILCPFNEGAYIVTVDVHLHADGESAPAGKRKERRKIRQYAINVSTLLQYVIQVE